MKQSADRALMEANSKLEQAAGSEIQSVEVEEKMSDRQSRQYYRDTSTLVIIKKFPFLTSARKLCIMLYCMMISLTRET